MKNKIVTTLSIIFAVTLIASVIVFNLPKKQLSFGGAGIVTATTSISFGFADFNSSNIANDTINQAYLDSGATDGRIFTYQRVQSKTPCTGSQCTTDGTYYYNWNDTASEYPLDTMFGQTDIQPYVMVGSSDGVSFPTSYSTTAWDGKFTSTLIDPLAYEAFLRELFKRYTGRIKVVVVNNEVGFGFIKTNGKWNDTAHNYVQSFINTSKIVKSIDPTIKIAYIEGNYTYGYNPDTNKYKSTDAMIELGGAPYIDIIDLHIYGTVTTDWFENHGENFTDYVTEMKRRYNSAGIYPEYWMGENGNGSGTLNDISGVLPTYYASTTYEGSQNIKQFTEAFSFGVTKAFLAVFYDREFGYLKETMPYRLSKVYSGLRCIKPDNTVDPYYYLDSPGVIIATSSTANIVKAYVYYTSVIDWRCSGILNGNIQGSDIDGAFLLRKKPSYYIYQLLTQSLKDTSFQSKVKTTNTTLHKFSNASKDVYVYWNNLTGTSSLSLTLPQAYTSGKYINGITLVSSTIPVVTNGTILTLTASSSEPQYVLLNK